MITPANSTGLGDWWSRQRRRPTLDIRTAPAGSINQQAEQEPPLVALGPDSCRRLDRVEISAEAHQAADELKQEPGQKPHTVAYQMPWWLDFALGLFVLGALVMAAVALCLLLPAAN